MTDTTHQAYETPITDLLRSIPADAPQAVVHPLSIMGVTLVAATQLELRVTPYITQAQFDRAFPAAPQAVPEGWPTHEMVKVGVRTLFDRTKPERSWEQVFEDAFKAALAAAPSPKDGK